MVPLNSFPVMRLQLLQHWNRIVQNIDLISKKRKETFRLIYTFIWVDDEFYFQFSSYVYPLLVVMPLLKMEQTVLINNPIKNSTSQKV